MYVNDQVVRAFLDEVWGRGRVAVAHRYIAPAYEVPGVGRGPSAVADNVRAFRAAFPDLSLEVENLLVDGNQVAVWMRLSGTHQGIFRGHEATGRYAIWDEVGFFTLAEGLISRGCFLADMFGLRKTLGIIPPDLR